MSSTPPLVFERLDLIEYYFLFQFDDLQDRAKTNLGDLERVQGEVNDYRKQVTTLEMELESLRGSVS